MFSLFPKLLESFNRRKYATYFESFHKRKYATYFESFHSRGRSACCSSWFLRATRITDASTAFGTNANTPVRVYSVTWCGQNHVSREIVYRNQMRESI